MAPSKPPIPTPAISPTITAANVESSSKLRNGPKMYSPMIEIALTLQKTQAPNAITYKMCPIMFTPVRAAAELCTRSVAGHFPYLASCSGARLGKAREETNRRPLLRVALMPFAS